MLHLPQVRLEQSHRPPGRFKPWLIATIKAFNQRRARERMCVTCRASASMPVMSGPAYVMC
ncbi:hypothetical protein [Stenotrophomonas sp. 9(2022)]|uniref:hypothetical protein n=1 Tax=Stenotrophomonas sp. 9(2022) TaxID=2950153 RepID=UPI0021149E10|nr:hypothetical protein [Stenotrophomonas sp. 9(2022)]